MNKNHALVRKHTAQSSEHTNTISLSHSHALPALTLLLSPLFVYMYEIFVVFDLDSEYEQMSLNTRYVRRSEWVTSISFRENVKHQKRHKTKRKTRKIDEKFNIHRNLILCNFFWSAKVFLCVRYAVRVCDEYWINVCEVLLSYLSAHFIAITSRRWWNFSLKNVLLPLFSLSVCFKKRSNNPTHGLAKWID